MRKYLDLHGKDVFNTKGKKIGFIDNAIFNYKNRKVTSYIINSGSLINKVYIVPLPYATYNDDEIIINKNPIKYKKRYINKNYKYTLDGLVGREVINKYEKLIGEVEDIIFNHITGDIKAFICKRGFFDDLIKGKRVLLVKDNIIIEKDDIRCLETNIEIISEISIRNSEGI